MPVENAAMELTGRDAGVHGVIVAATAVKAGGALVLESRAKLARGKVNSRRQVQRGDPGTAREDGLERGIRTAAADGEVLVDFKIEQRAGGKRFLPQRRQIEI